VAKQYKHTTMATKITQEGNGLTPEWAGRRVSLRAPSPDVAAPTDADAGQTDVSVDPARRTARTPSGRPLSVTATTTATSLDGSPADSPAAPTTTASAMTSMPADGPGSRGLVPANRRTTPAISAGTPSVAYDGDLDVSRRTPAPGLVRRADAAPCVLPGNIVDDPDVAPRNRSSQLTAAAALTTRSSTSPNKSHRLLRSLS